MSKKLPAIQFYTGDYLKDPELSLCSSSTRGVWMDLLCRMHESGRSGTVTGTVEQLCRLCRATTAEITLALTELSQSCTAVVSERNGIYTVINRRMKGETRERVAAAKRQQKFRDKTKGVTFSNEKVTPTKTPANVENKEDEKMKRKSNAEITSYSSISSSFSNTNTVQGGGGTTRARDDLPPAAAPSEIEHTDESLDDFLIRLQTEYRHLDVREVFSDFKKDCLARNVNPAEASRARLEKFIRRKDFLRRMGLQFPQHDVLKVYRKFASLCGSTEYPRMRNNEATFMKFLTDEYEDFDEVVTAADGGENDVYVNPFTGKRLGE